MLEAAGVFDLSFRSRICLTGADRVRFLHGQVTNDVKRALALVTRLLFRALPTAKGKDPERREHLLRFRMNCCWTSSRDLRHSSRQRLEKYIVADDVQVVDVPLAHYGLLSVQGPKAEAVMNALLAALQLRLPDVTIELSTQ